jgi:hypothetical protein
MTPLMLVSLGVLLIFVLGVLTGQGIETRSSRTRGRRQAALQRELNEMRRATHAPAGELHLVAVAGPLPQFAYSGGLEDDD